MGKINAFNQISLDGYFTDARNDMSWAHKDPNDVEWNEYVGGNSSGDGGLLFGRITYELMAGFWPTPQAAAMMPEVAAGMNRMKKYVFSRTLTEVAWQNSTLLKDDLATEVRKLKSGPSDLAILGSGSLIAQLTDLRLIDQYQFVMNPIVLGSGRTTFQGVKERLSLRHTSTRTFKNGNVVISYELPK
ncbi:MAG: dihydrofolate reductase family protein [Vicinamibacteria bacterium]